MMEKKIQKDFKNSLFLKSLLAPLDFDATTLRHNLDGPSYNGPTCDCDYDSGGCRIAKAPPPGYKCYCENWFIATCSGYPTECSQSEVDNGGCPGDTWKESCDPAGNCGWYG